MGPTERPLFPLGTRPPFSMRPASRGRKCLCETGPSLKADRMKVKELRPESKVDVIDLTIRQKGAVRDFSSRAGSPERWGMGKGATARAPRAPAGLGKRRTDGGKGTAGFASPNVGVAEGGATSQAARVGKGK